MIENISVVTVLFDYPSNYIPTFYKKAEEYFTKENIHIARFNNLIQTKCYYEKLYYYKVEKLREFIKENIKTDLMMFLDATDTNFITAPNNLEEKFKQFNCSILFCAEKGLWPPTEFNHLYNNKRVISEKKYLNSGSYIGYTNKILTYMENIITNPKCQVDDQGKWAIQYLHNEDIVIDQECKIFFSSYLNKNDVEIIDNKPTLKALEACVVHDNGGYDEGTLKLVPLL